MPTYAEVTVGTKLPSQEFAIRRVDLVRYCGASGDFNELHWNDREAEQRGLPTVIAHGMFTMAEAVRVVTDWLGDPGRVVSYRVRFSAPVPVPDDEHGATISVSGVVEEKRPGNQVVVALVATLGPDSPVLSSARAIVTLA